MRHTTSDRHSLRHCGRRQETHSAPSSASGTRPPPDRQPINCRRLRQRADARRRPRDDGRGVTVSKERSGAPLSKSQGGPSGLRGSPSLPRGPGVTPQPRGDAAAAAAGPGASQGHPPARSNGNSAPPAARRPAALLARPPARGPAERGTESDARRLGSAERRAGLRRRVSGMLMPPRQGSAAPATP